VSTALSLESGIWREPELDLYGDLGLIRSILPGECPLERDRLDDLEDGDTPRRARDEPGLIIGSSFLRGGVCDRSRFLGGELARLSGTRLGGGRESPLVCKVVRNGDFDLSLRMGERGDDIRRLSGVGDLESRRRTNVISLDRLRRGEMSFLGGVLVLSRMYDGGVRERLNRRRLSGDLDLSLCLVGGDRDRRLRGDLERGRRQEPPPPPLGT